MTILGMRSFDRGSTMLNAADVSGGVPTASVTYAKTGAYSLKMDSSGAGTSQARWALSGTPDNPAVSLWLRPGNSSAFNSSSFYLRWLLTSGEYIDLRWNRVTHTFDAYVNNVLVATGTREVSSIDWFHVQFSVTVSDTGNIGVLIDGHSSINYNGDTMPGVTDTVEYLYAYITANMISWYIDDLVFGSGGPLGDIRVYEKCPIADSTVQWTPSTGASNYALEDETPPSDADYNYTTVNGHADEFNLSALDITGFDVCAVVAWSRAKMDSGAGDSIDVGVNSGGTISVNRSALSASWEYYFGNVHETDPHTGLVWDQAGLNALLHRKVAVIV